MAQWWTQHGGLSHWDDDRGRYQARLETESYKAWEINSAIGFGGFVIAATVAEVTNE
jgi:hypothetical protein